METWPSGWQRRECLNRVFQEVQKIDFFPLPLNNLWENYRPGKHTESTDYSDISFQNLYRGVEVEPCTKWPLHCLGLNEPWKEGSWCRQGRTPSRSAEI